jgi:predicted aspartyl protease
MMFGVVNNNCEAIIKVAVGPIGSPKIALDAIIDTGFTSFLSLPLAVITDIGLALVLSRYWHIRGRERSRF